MGGGLNLSLGSHRQGEQADQRIKPRLLAELFQAQPDHAIKKLLQLLRHLGWPEPEAPVRHHHDNGQMQHLGMELEKASGLGK